MIAPKTVYAAVRQDQTDGHEWIDTSTVSSLKAVAKDKADKADIDNVGDVSEWAKENPVVRVARFTMVEEFD